MKAIQDFLKNLISKFNFHSIENMKIFLNFIISARWMLIKIMEYPDKIQILSIIFMKLYPLKMEAGRYCSPPQKMGSSWKHLGEINLERQYQRSIPVSFWPLGKKWSNCTVLIVNLSFVPFVGYKHCHMRLPRAPCRTTRSPLRCWIPWR